MKVLLGFLAVIACLYFVFPMISLGFLSLIDSYKKHKEAFVVVFALLLIIILLIVSGLMGYALMVGVLLFVVVSMIKDLKSFLTKINPNVIFAIVIIAIGLLFFVLLKL